MDNNNDFYQSFEYSKKQRKGNSVISSIAVSFISAIVGASCALLIYTHSPISNNIQLSNDTSRSALETSASSNNNNINLEQVSLSNYSDTAIYAANKVLPSMVSISVGYGVNYFGMTQTATATGSGVIISEDGYILTNNHVINASDSSSFYKVSDANTITVKIYGDDTEYDAKIIGTDKQTDLAVIKIEKDGLTAAEFGDSSSVQVGEFVLAIGDPYGLDYSVTAGIISALNREMTVENTVYKVIQADCAINSGNSGGALVNSKGQVIGITTLKLSGNGIEGVSFAIPINDTTSIYKELIEKGKISRPFIGISGIDVDEATAIRNNLTKGIYVDTVIKDSSAEQAGIQKGDIITKFDGKPISTMDELNEIKDTKNVGDKVEITFYRKNEEHTVTLTLGEN